MVNSAGSNPQFDSGAAASFGESDVTRNCPHCHTDFSQLPASARYCPRCGWDKQRASGSDSADPTQASGDAARLQLEPLTASSRTPPTLPTAQPARSPLLRGFASAIYRLGVRYEGGLGSRHNRSEAERCFFKAAKLGNQDAMARINPASLPEEGSPAADERSQ